MTNGGRPKLLKGGQTLYLERTSINQLAHSRDAPVTNAGDHAWITGKPSVESLTPAGVSTSELPTTRTECKSS
jgi:hypothetical protein